MSLCKISDLEIRRSMDHLQSSSYAIVQGFREAFISFAQNSGLRIYVT
jgi:hypothetical protein